MNEPRYAWPPGQTSVSEFYLSRGLHNPRRPGDTPCPESHTGRDLLATVPWGELLAWLVLDSWLK